MIQEGQPIHAAAGQHNIVTDLAFEAKKFTVSEDSSMHKQYPSDVHHSAISSSSNSFGSTARLCGWMHAIGLSALMVIPIPVVGQTAIPNADNYGKPVSAVFSGGQLDSVNLHTGDLHVDIPLLDLPGIGLGTHIHYVYDNLIYNQAATTSNPIELKLSEDRSLWGLRDQLEGGVTMVDDARTINCNGVITSSNYIDYASFEDLDGTSHQLPLNGFPPSASCAGQGIVPQKVYSADASGIMVTLDNYGSVTAAIDKHGNSYSRGAVEDANGNRITAVFGTPDSNEVATETITDTANRQITIVRNYGYSYTFADADPVQSLSYLDQNGNTQTITVTMSKVPVDPTVLCGAFPISSCFPPNSGSPVVATGTVYLPHQIALQNGDTYTFTYLSKGLGEIQSITLPTGGVISYTWGTPGKSGRGVTSRTVTANGTSATWQFSDTSATQVTVTDPLQNDTVYTCVNQLSTYQFDSASCYPTEEDFYVGSSTAKGNTPLATKKTFYTISGAVMPTRTTFTWNATGQTTETDTSWESIPNSGWLYGNYSGTDNPTYDFSRGNKTSEVVYDFGSGTRGSLVSNTAYSYLHNQKSAYLAANIADRVAQVSLYNAATASAATLVSQATTSYDNFNQTTVNGQGSLASAVGTTNHDYTKFGTSATLRGLPTSSSLYTGAGLTAIVTYTDYNDLGMKTITTDGRGNSTTYAYGAQNAFLTSTTLPTISGVSHVLGESHDVNTGLLLSQTDENKNATSYTFDALMRPLTITRPDGGTTVYSYPDPNHIDVSTPIDSNTSETSVIVLDGLGRTTQTKLTSDLGGTDLVDTTYDLLGRIQSLSNPYRSISDPTYGITSYSYDAMGRNVYQCQPDNTSNASTTCTPQKSFESWTYNGNVMTFKDEAGNQWQRTSDALGRLTKVLEPDPSSNALTLETDYTYDALNNLLSVNQKGGSGDTPRVRTFTYDSLSRLICASNPENSSAACPTSATSAIPSGVIAYSYDTNGNVSSKTDARGVVTGYKYDALNRLISKSSSGYLTSCYQYDGSEANGTGRLANEWTQTGASCPTAAPSSGAITLRSIQAYDQMGRIKTEQECAPGVSCTTSSGPQLWYGYDLAGNQTCLVNNAAPTTTLTVGTPPCLSRVFGTPNGLLLTNNYDPAGHLQSITSNWTAYPTNIYTLGTNGYGPVGPLSWTLGPKVSVAESYSNRLRVNSITASPTP